MFPRQRRLRLRYGLPSSSQSPFTRHSQQVSLSLFRDKKSVVEKSAVPSIHHTGTYGAFYPPLKLSSAVAARPKREKRRLPLFPDDGPEWSAIRGDSAGDDAWVVGKYYLGVADGVGAWNTKEMGRPHLWSRLLMHYWALECEERMQLWKVDRATSGGGTDSGLMKVSYGDEQEVDVVAMLHRAYLRTAIDMERTGGWVGSTTACVGLVQRSTLHIANLGDSRAFIIRGNKFIFTTAEQQHWYDCPYQVGTNSTDTPLNDATSHVVKLLPSDTIVLATDGLSDNLWDQEILSEVSGDNESGTPKRDIQDIADTLCKRARTVGEDKWGESPFMEKAIMEGLPFHGGKLDDISIVVAKAELDKE